MKRLPKSRTKYRKKQSNIRCKSDITIPVNRKKLLSVIEKLKQPKKKMKDQMAKGFNKNCFSEHDQLKWESPLHLVRYIRKCAATQDWQNLAPLILHLIGKKINIYTSYIREITFLAMLMNKQNGGEDLFEDFVRLCFVRVPNTDEISKYDMWFEEQDIKLKQ